MKSPLLLLLLFPLSTMAADKHVHGEADLFIAINNQQVLIELESPAANIVGFEHKPHNSDEKAIVSRSLDLLANYKQLIQFPDGECKQVSADIKNPFTAMKEEKHSEKHDHGHHDHHDHGNEAEGHAEFHAEYTLSCKNTQGLKKALVRAFETFSGLEKVTVNWLNTSKQGTSTMTPSKTTIEFN